MNVLVASNIAIAAFCFVISVIILVSVVLSEHGREKHSRVFIYIIITNLILLLASKVWFYVNGNPAINSPFPLIFSEILKASCGPVMLILYTKLILVIVRDKLGTDVSRKIKYAARIAVILCIADIISIIGEPFFSSQALIGDNNQLIRQDWFLVSYLFTFLTMAINAGILISHRKYFKNKEMLTLIAYMLIPALGVVFHMIVAGTPINMMSITVAIVYYFAIIQNDMSRQTHQWVEYNSMLYKTAPIGLCLFNKDNKFSNYNDQILIMLGAERQSNMDIISEYSPEYQPDGTKSKDKAYDFIIKTMSGDKQVFEWTLKSKSGELIPCEVTTVLAKYKGENVGLSFVYDLRHVMHLERELVESKISVLLSQIKPHFLYNALSAIVQLCDEAPALAKKAAMDFSAYLRSNMESLNNKRLISIEKEIDHVQHYLSLEKAIYGQALDIIYNIDAEGFGVPPLSIQPIVENAVKHGIGKKEGGGTIIVSVSCADDGYIITVTDDGVGFDVNKPIESKNKHIGISNVRKRLELCGGTLSITSTLSGTIARITLPVQTET